MNANIALEKYIRVRLGARFQMIFLKSVRDGGYLGVNGSLQDIVSSALYSVMQVERMMNSIGVMPLWRDDFDANMHIRSTHAQGMKWV
jgi:hypothetical protein